MTGLARIAGSEVIRRFAGRYYAIVAGCAVIDDAGMVEGSTGEAGGVVAGNAILGCRNMRYGLTSGPAHDVAAIMAGHAVVANALVIEDATGKASGGMANVATLSSGYVILRFAGGRHTMAGLAIVEDARMIEPGSHKTAGPMAYATVLVGLNMPGCFTLCEHAIVAGLAIIYDPDMNEACRHKARCDVA